MSRELFSGKEFKVIGEYPPINTAFFAPMPSVPPQPKFYRPITPMENWKLILDGKRPYWIPFGGWLFCDINLYRPRINPDNVATHIVIDGGPNVEYESNTMVSDWFDLTWVFVPEVNGATVRPGSPKVPDISEWEKHVSIPSIEDLDWERCKEENKDYLNVDKMNQLGILSGFWERLISLLDVENAAVATNR